MYKLLRNFSITSAVAFVVVTVCFVVAYFNYQVHALNELTRASNETLARTFANVIWARHGSLITGARAGGDAPAWLEALDKQIKSLVTDQQIVKINIYSPEGIIIYSTDSKQIDTSSAANNSFVQVVAGNAIDNKFSYHPKFTAIHGTLKDVQVSQTFVPITGGTGRIVSVFEIYADVTASVQRIRRDIVSVILMSLAGFGSLYLALFAIVRRADGTISQQYAELEASKSTLEDRVRERTAEYESVTARLSHSNMRLMDEVEVRKRAERKLVERREALLSQQYALTDLIRNGAIGKAENSNSIRALVEVAAKTLGISRVSVWLLNDEADTISCLDLFEVESASHSDDQVLHARDFPGYFAALRAGEPIIAHDARQHPATRELAESYLVPNGIMSLLDTPIMRGGRLEGVVCNETIGVAIEWSPEQVLFATTIANLIALAIEGRERLEAVQQNELRTEGLVAHQRTVDAVLCDGDYRAGDRAAALRALSRISTRSLDADYTSVWLLDEKQTTISFGEIFQSRRGAFVTPDWAAEPWFAGMLVELAGKRIAAFNDVEDHIKVMPRMRAVYEQADIRSVVYAPITVQGRLIGFYTCAMSRSRISWTADQLLYVASIINLAVLAIERCERERAQAELKEVNDRLKRATQAKSEFLANMSHEIRTPMNGVFGMTDLLGRTELTGRQRRLVGIISQSAKTLLTIINDILDLSRIEAGRLEIESRPFDIRHTVEGVGELFAEEAQLKGLDLSILVADGIPQHLIGDPGRLRQILVNLIGNAIKFTHKGHVSLRATARHDDALGRRMSLVVSDTGIGIDATIQKRLFGAFMQADSSISRQFGGTGLGLSISRHLVELMGGSIALESAAGRGTTVRIDLPIVEATGANCAPVDRSLLEGKRILVVDDRAVNREIVCTYLSGRGAKMTEAESGARGLSVLEAAARSGAPFDLLLLDVVMSDMHGLELLATIRARKEISQIRVVLLTSLDWKSDSHSPRELGVDCVLSKPIRHAELLDEVARALAVAPVRSEAATLTARSSKPITWSGARVLIVEDNPVNVEVAREVLEQLKCETEVAHNGIEALSAFERSSYALILMDVQMPEMDGLTATRRIREIEQAGGRAPTSIIGVTANAYEGDRAVCLAAGMNDYISKPFTQTQVESVLKRWLGSAASRPSTAYPKSAPPVEKASMPATASVTQPGLAPEAASPISERLIAGLEATRPELLKRMVRIYLDYAPKAVAGLKRSMEAFDLIAVKLAAHSLKSSSANVGGEVISGLFKRLEAAAIAQDKPLAARLVCEVDREFQRLEAALDQRFAAHGDPGKTALSA